MFKANTQTASRLGTTSHSLSHSLSAAAAHNHLSSSAAAFIKVLDINDNVPRLARDYRPYICEGTQAGEVCTI